MRTHRSSAGLIALAISMLFVSGCSSTERNEVNVAANAAAPKVGEVWYVMDHAYTSEVYQVIQQRGVEEWPAQTTSGNPNKSYHLARPYLCTISQIGTDGFYKCNIDSDHTLDVQAVWSNRLMNKEQAEAAAPGTVIHIPEPTEPGTPKWLKIRPGLKLYTGYDGGDATTVTVCSTRAEYKESSNGSDSRCDHRKPGIPIHVVSSSDDYSLDGSTNIPVLRVAADNGSWIGYTGSLVSVQPRIPRGTVLLTDKHPPNDAKSEIWIHRIDPNNSGLELENGARVQVLKQDSTDPANATLYVSILSGRYAGRRGWVLDSGLSADGKGSILLSP